MIWSMWRTFYQQGGLTLLVIGIMSIVALGVGLERLFSTWLFRRRMLTAAARVIGHLRDDNPTMAQAVNASLPAHPATAFFTRILHHTRGGATGELRRCQAKIVRYLRRRLWLLASIGAISPFVGLLGTVLGVMEAFESIGAEGAGGFQVVSAGISEALITTAGGIFVGIEAVLLFNFLQVYATESATLLKEAAEEMLESLPEAGHGPPSAQSPQP